MCTGEVSTSACTASSPDPRVNAVEQALTKCPDQVIEGLDVYSGTGTIDWSKVQASGRGFAFIKATQGDYNVQTTFATNWANARFVTGIFRTHVLQMAPVHLVDDFHVPGQERSKKTARPLFQGLRQQRVIGVAKRRLRHAPGVVPWHRMLIHQQPHQLGNADGRVRVVQLNRPLLIEFAE